MQNILSSGSESRCLRQHLTDEFLANLQKLVFFLIPRFKTRVIDFSLSDQDFSGCVVEFSCFAGSVKWCDSSDENEEKHPCGPDVCLEAELFLDDFGCHIEDSAFFMSDFEEVVEVLAESEVDDFDSLALLGLVHHVFEFQVAVHCLLV